MTIEVGDVSGISTVAADVWERGAVSLTDEQLRDGIRSLESSMRQQIAVQLQCVAEAERRDLPVHDGARNAIGWLQALLRISGTDARARVAVAHDIEQPATMTGPPLPAERPATARALRDGQIGLEHAHTIVRGMRQIASLVSRQHASSTEALLVEQATVLDPRQVRVIVERARYYVDQDGALRDEQRQIRDRELQYAVAPDGMTVLKGRVDRETGAELRAVLEPRPHPHPSRMGSKTPAARGNATPMRWRLCWTWRYRPTACPGRVGNARTSPSPSTLTA